MAQAQSAAPKTRRSPTTVALVDILAGSDADAAARMTRAMFRMKKLDVAALLAAARGP
jgi:hypothetical protein